MSHKGSRSRVNDQQAYRDNLAEILANSRKQKASENTLEEKEPDSNILVDNQQEQGKTQEFTN